MKEKFLRLRKKENMLFLLQIVLAAALPWICTFVYLLCRGKSLGEVWLPGSEWNDELFYFKQVEGMVRYGYPQGFFGFNESHALRLSFAAWSPVLLFPWVLWGKLFGWTLLSPYLCNLFLLSAVMGAYVWLVRPSWRQEGILAVLFCLYAPFVRYLLSGMPEILCFSLMILFYAVAIREVREPSARRLCFMILLGIAMTLMRPYFILLLLLPVFLLIRRYRWKGVLLAALVMGGALGGYGMIKHYYGAAYFADLFFTDWIHAFFERGLFGGLRYTLGKLYYMGLEFGRHMIEGARNGLASGAHFACFMILLLIFLCQTVTELWEVRHRKDTASKERDDYWIIEGHFLFSMIAMFFAILLMYKLTEGSKHLLTFAATGIFLICLMDTKHFLKPVIAGAVFVYFYWWMARSAYDYQVPFLDTHRASQLETWQVRMAGEMDVEQQASPSFDNVVIWVLSDEVQEKTIYSKWQLLYALPGGMGISCCESDYVLEHSEKLQSKYLITISNGAVDKRFHERGVTELFRDEDMVLYRCH